MGAFNDALTLTHATSVQALPPSLEVSWRYMYEQFGEGKVLGLRDFGESAPGDRTLGGPGRLDRGPARLTDRVADPVELNMLSVQKDV